MMHNLTDFPRDPEMSGSLAPLHQLPSASEDINRTNDSITENVNLTESNPPMKPPLLAQTTVMVAILSTAYFVVFVLALVNNSVVVSVIYKNAQMRTVTNMFLANLAVADILVSLVVLPFTLFSVIFTEWHYGNFLCKAMPYLQAVVVSASVNTLAAVAVERYFAIYYPHKSVITHKRAQIIIVVIWIVPMCIQVPWALFYGLDYFAAGTVRICHPKSITNEKGFFLGIVFLTCYLIPLLFISIFYSMIGFRVWKRSVTGIRGSRAERNIQRSKIRIVRMLITMALVFAFLWLPLYSLRMRYYFGPPMKGQTKVIVMRIIVPIAQWLSSVNSCVNPFIYCYFSEQFRKYILGFMKDWPLIGRLVCCQSSNRQ